jgi:hypothetical protein
MSPSGVRKVMVEPIDAVDNRLLKVTATARLTLTVVAPSAGSVAVTAGDVEDAGALWARPIELNPPINAIRNIATSHDSNDAVLFIYISLWREAAEIFGEDTLTGTPMQTLAI